MRRRHLTPEGGSNPKDQDTRILHSVFSAPLPNDVPALFPSLAALAAIVDADLLVSPLLVRELSDAPTARAYLDRMAVQREK